ncbi:MAG: hypothetical protein IKS92_01595 [Victivallales bacterium]|nr:hypothetical protein [Victivallales bacterium]
MSKTIDATKLHEALNLLHEQLILINAPAIELVVYGGSALIATGLIPRTTQDVDILAFMEKNQLKDSEPLPPYLIEAADKVGKILGLPENWLNNGPAVQFQMGLPDGFQQRLQQETIGKKLVIHYISRYDQIFFKTFASADRGGYHVSDLKKLNPSEDELVEAAKWCMTQDVSEEFHQILIAMFQQLGWPNVSNRI